MRTPLARSSSSVSFPLGRHALVMTLHSRQRLATTRSVFDQLSFSQPKRQCRRSSEAAHDLSDSRAHRSERCQCATAMTGIIYEMSAYSVRT